MEPTISQNNYNVLVFKQRRGSHPIYMDLNIMFFNLKYVWIAVKSVKLVDTMISLNLFFFFHVHLKGMLLTQRERERNSRIH